MTDELLAVQDPDRRARAQLRGVVIAQVRRVEVVQVRRRADERALASSTSSRRRRSGTRGCGPCAGRLKPGRLEHRRPEQRVEIGDVLADEVVDFDVVVRATSRRASRPRGGTTRPSRRCSRSARRTRRTSSCPGCRESRSRNRAPAARRPNRAAARPGNGRPGSWRPRAAGDRRSASTRSRKPCSCSMCTNKCSASRSSGVAPDSVLTGSIRSVGL